MHDRWEIVHGRPPRPVAGPRYSVTVNPRGEIYFNQEVFQAIGRPASVTLLFDPADRRLAIKYPAVADLHFHRVFRCGRNRKTLLVRAARMLDQFQFSVPQTTRLWNLHLEMLGEEKMIMGEICP